MNPEDETANKQADEQTRRQWLLRLGGAAVLFGFRGVPGGTQAATEGRPASTPSSLPPGLYDPSSDHLAHALTADSLFHPIPAGTESDYRQPRTGPFHPQFFSPEEFQTIRRIVEIVLDEPKGSAELEAGTTHGVGSVTADTAEWVDFVLSNAAALREAARKLSPEHRALAIHYYGREAVEKLETEQPEKTCREGLASLSEESSRRYGKTFLALDEPRQIELITSMSDERKEKSGQDSGARFIGLMKGEIIRGFYTSRAGLKELDYKGNSFYAESPGCERHGHSRKV